MQIKTNQSFIRSFGRTKSRSLSNNKKRLLVDLLPKYQIKEFTDIISSKDFLLNFREIVLDIGFGLGDSLFKNAKDNPDTLFIGCEPYVNGIVNLLSSLQEEPLENLKIFVGDIRVFLQSTKNKVFNKIYILFPDPWPKFKHYKRRLINVDFLKLLHSKSTLGCQLMIATDDNNYKTWIMAEYFGSNVWKWLAKDKNDWINFPSNWIRTKYQVKAEIAKKEIAFIDLVSISNLSKN